MGDRPEYDHFTDMREVRGPLGEAFARQVLETTGSQLSKPVGALDVLDIGSGYGHTALGLARVCSSVLGLEPSAPLVAVAEELARSEGLANLAFRHGGVETLTLEGAFDLVVLDNVYEHLPNQADALDRINLALRPGGVLYLLVPNRAWPIEAHYRLPGLSWLPLRWANAYLRWSGRGTDYEDASYAPTYFSLRRMLRGQLDWDFEFTLPGVPSATVAGTPWHYRLGMRLLGRCPGLWAISKALLVVAVKREHPTRAPG